MPILPTQANQDFLKVLGGGIGRAIDVVGNVLGNPFPEIQAFGSEGLSGFLESRGSEPLTTQQRITESISQGKGVARGDVRTASQLGVNPFTIPVREQGITPTQQTTQQPAPTQPTAPADTRLQQLQKTNRNPIQEDEFQRIINEALQNLRPDEGQLSSVFDPIFGALSQAEANLRGQQPGLISEAEEQARVSTGLIEGQRTGAEELLGQQTSQTEIQRQRQVADQRRILQELQQANQARFGGASSAGVAASEIQGREFQRSRFGIQQNAQQALQAIGNERNRVEREFQQGLQQIELNKQQAINDVNRRFQDKLLEIDARRGETESSKALARMTALQEFKNKSFEVKIAEAQFKFDLQNQVQADTTQLSQLEQQFLGFTGAGQAAATQFGQTTPSGIPGVEVGGRQASPQLTGQIRDEDLIGQIGSIPGSSDTDPRFQNFVPGFSR